MEHLSHPCRWLREENGDMWVGGPLPRGTVTSCRSDLTVSGSASKTKPNPKFPCSAGSACSDPTAVNYPYQKMQSYKMSLRNVFTKKIKNRYELLKLMGNFFEISQLV